MLVLAFGPFAFVEIVTLGFSWAWAVWGWRMLHISVPVAAQGHWEELGALGSPFHHLSTTFPPCSLVGITAPPGFPRWAAQLPRFFLILWPRGLSTLKSPAEPQTWARAATRESQRSLFPLFWFILFGSFGNDGNDRYYTFSLTVIDLKESKRFLVAAVWKFAQTFLKFTLSLVVERDRHWYFFSCGYWNEGFGIFQVEMDSLGYKLIFCIDEQTVVMG